MNELNSYIKERESYIKKLILANKRLDKSASTLETKILTSEINGIKSNLQIIDTVIEEIKFNKEMW